MFYQIEDKRGTKICRGESTIEAARDLANRLSARWGEPVTLEVWDSKEEHDIEEIYLHCL